MDHPSVLLGLMRPGKAHQNTRGYPVEKCFFQHFYRKEVGRHDNNNDVQCCLYYAHGGTCHLSDWEDYNGDPPDGKTWDGMERMSYGDKMGMLLDFDEGTLTVYKNGRKLGVMRSGLAGPYCWVVSLLRGTSVTIKRGTAVPQ